MTRTTILLADDHTMFSTALKKLLEPEYEVVGCVEDGRTLVKTALDLKPNLVLVDIGIPLLNGLDAGLAERNQARNHHSYLRIRTNPELHSYLHLHS